MVIILAEEPSLGPVAAAASVLTASCCADATDPSGRLTPNNPTRRTQFFVMQPLYRESYCTWLLLLNLAIKPNSVRLYDHA